MNRDLLANAIFVAGLAHFGVLIASALVPFQLQWRTELASLSRLHRQMYWVYGGYVVLSILAFGLLSIVNASALASGDALARGVCAYIAVFWGVRLILQGVFDVREHLKSRWLQVGYLLLTVLFAGFTVVYGLAGLSPHLPEQVDTRAW